MKSVGIIGAGKLGRTIYEIATQEWARIRGIGQVHLVDHASTAGRLDVRDSAALSDFVAAHDGIISALPSDLNPEVAGACLAQNTSYFDFSEDMSLLQSLRQAATSSDATFVPQCGFSPGIVNTVVGSVVQQFDSIDQMDIRVGTVPVTMTNQMKYYCSWNTMGLVRQYTEPADALHRGEPIKRLPLDGLESDVIDGVEYEAFTVGGGSASLCETFAGQIQSLTYKTLRYPGHCQHVRFLVRDLNLQSRPTLLAEVTNHGIPLAEEDVAIIYIATIGQQDGEYRLRHYPRKIQPFSVIPHSFSAIQCATAGSMAAVLELWATDKLPRGLVSHERIPLVDFSTTRWGEILLSRTS